MAPKQAATKPIRNLAHVNVRIRLGSKRDPYHIDLQPRGRRGDVQYIPVDLMDHPAFLSNKGRIFEVITKLQADKIEYEDFQGERYLPEGMLPGVQVTRQKDAEVVVSTYTEDEKGKLRETSRGRHGVEVDEAVGIKRATVRGTEDNPIPSHPQRAASPVEEPLPSFKGVEKGV